MSLLIQMLSALEMEQLMNMILSYPAPFLIHLEMATFKVSMMILTTMIGLCEMMMVCTIISEYNIYALSDTTLGIEYTCQNSVDYGSAYLFNSYYEDSSCNLFTYFDAFKAKACIGSPSGSFKFYPNSNQLNIWFNSQCSGIPFFGDQIAVGTCLYQSRRLDIISDDAISTPSTSTSYAKVGSKISDNGEVSGKSGGGSDGEDSNMIMAAIIGLVVGVGIALIIVISLCIYCNRKPQYTPPVDHEAAVVVEVVGT